MKNTTTKSIFERTRTDALPAYNTDNAFKQFARQVCSDAREKGQYYGYDKAVAAMIRKHLRAQFPECKFSVTSGGAGYLECVNISLLSAPYEKKSEITEAIINYADALHKAFDSDDGDYYADYGAHHDLYGSAQISYKYAQTPETPESINNIVSWRLEVAADKIKKQKEAEEAYRKREEEYKKAAAEAEKREKERTARLESGIISITDAPAFVTNVNAACIGKEADYKELIETLEERPERLVNAATTRTIDFTPDGFNAFCDCLLADFEPINGFGGYEIDDDKPGDYADKFVKYINCVLITIEGTPKMVVDPEGYSYARYCYPLTEKSLVFNTVTTE